jgi:hypothetical protein
MTNQLDRKTSGICRGFRLAVSQFERLNGREKAAVLVCGQFMITTAAIATRGSLGFIETMREILDKGGGSDLPMASAAFLSVIALNAAIFRYAHHHARAVLRGELTFNP